MKKLLITFFCIPVWFIQSYGFDSAIVKNILPDFAIVQCAGNIGVVSGGFGYSFFKNKMLTSVSYGFVPHFIGGTTVHTIALRNNFKIYEFTLNKENQLVSYANVGVNFEPGEHSYIELPKKYPNGYYATNSFHFPLGLGLRIDSVPKHINFAKSSLFAEVGTLATYIYYEYMAQKRLTETIASLSFGLLIFW
ncbi:MAG TPA: hypothetical protein DCQ26_05620 [Marinilabiliales bacterium]|nr:MAG: hypothetical protein A2W95_05570 [Bacteroidetes bacterium GWA2_40_14]OFX74001.1 MAG: hypothetical protein A2W96_11850 [Bacteroidetes bacterium GWD2_40_43]OFX93164.1 MAG: hypothetical protein A2W97_06220 [Bacteroidetes bacterium GWE2_40_63]OFY21534.1 MAG: hypothetical protein A2W88_10220 [Bacteroidetes bacterium GWF2_40_13]OFZ24187.1 MAG: hypothetical protein A2437_17355 [Bacteroidetes bacterium RIFOXYC2_FULL_40_12]HAM98069.1 hypothetical protein [Marinilabiliales bacterium]